MSDEYSDSHTDSESKKSKYNSAIAQLYRMDDLWKDAHRHSRDISYGKWNEDLDRIWAELSSDASDKDQEKMDAINLNLTKLSIYGLNPKIKKHNPPLYAKIITLQKKYLMEKEICLRVLQNKQGKGSAYEDTIEDYMDEGY